jgi:hypothetical protein
MIERGRLAQAGGQAAVIHELSRRGIFSEIGEGVGMD